MEGSSKTVFFQTATKDDDIPFPYHPCMVYLPTFTIKINHMDCMGFHMTVVSFFWEHEHPAGSDEAALKGGAVLRRPWR